MFHRMFSTRNTNANGKDSIINLGAAFTKKISKDAHLISLVKDNEAPFATQILVEGINAANKHFVRSYSIVFDTSIKRLQISELLKNKKSILNTDSTTLCISITKAEADQFDLNMRNEQENLSNAHTYRQNYSPLIYPGDMTSYSWAQDRLIKNFKIAKTDEIDARFKNIPTKPELFNWDSTNRDDVWTYRGDHETRTTQCKSFICGGS